MPATPESEARTRAFARHRALARHRSQHHRGARAGNGTFLSGFFKNGVLVWFAGGLLLFGGLLIIAFHQYCAHRRS